ncbi:uncharacterized protein AH6.3-like [Trachypithecus francoisi]|uniref:uncharacterized protein AH6.3-like n=1 Tax=Trachypithecus francoisi TaxID=54180 RepID=UPI00141B86D2|nr:uncharacterized protein AH6.3-like [Trachypithecus francoisi]XP_033070203.1 uncharacterized protein AH6.3-like [Trachypithecus francoisi]
MAKETHTPVKPKETTKQPIVSTKKPTPRTKEKKEKKSSRQQKTNKTGKVEKKIIKVKKPLQRNSRKKTQSPPSCSKKPRITMRPTTFACHHKQNKTQNKTQKSKHKIQRKIKIRRASPEDIGNSKPSQVTISAASKCRAWIRNVQLATASP